VWTTPASAAALLGFFGRHRSTGIDLMWAGPSNDTLALVLPEQDVNHESWFRQMLRLVDVPAAFEARGYPAPLDAAVEIQIEDPALGWNDAGWRIEISGGTAKVSPAPSARARVDVRTLASMFSGFLSAKDARRLGRLAATDAEVASLDAMLAGPAPWINDWF
jgi:predicted acetyltransferase